LRVDIDADRTRVADQSSIRSRIMLAVPAAAPYLPWALLLLAGLLEVLWAVLMKASDGFARHGLAALCIAIAWLSFFLLGFAAKTLPIGTAYAVWTGIGAAGVAVLGVVLFGEALTLVRVACIAFIVAGIVGLKLAGTH
jgi:quaternary ammonium compound-resistance protein SugE